MEMNGVPLPGLPATALIRSLSRSALASAQAAGYDKRSGNRSDEKKREGASMKAEFTAIIEAAPEGGFWAMCPEVSGANGQGETVEEATENLRGAIELILEDRRADVLRGLPEDAIQSKVRIG